MTFDVTVSGTDITFPCAPDETVLDAAERAGYAIPYSCRKGVCSTCEGGLATGELQVRGKGLTRGPATGVLLCQARPCSSVEISPKRIVQRAAPVRKVISAKVHRITRPNTDVVVLNLRFPSGVRAKFQAGQYLKVLMEDGDSRNYSMANAPHESDGVQLHIRHVPGGRFSEGVLARLEKGDVLKVELPYGDFSLDEAVDHPVILLGTGTGMAPLKSIIEDQIKRGGSRPLHLYWGARNSQDLYLADQPELWSKRLPGFIFTPVLSEPEPGWSGRTGWVHRAVLEDYPDLSAHQVYACGNPIMINAALSDLTAEGRLSPEAFYCDAFVPSGDLQPTP
ncbi:flavin oxidoreductase [Pseudomonas agarici]|uniref:Flavin oxidoreductase n=1 Tax=Pseudomonas agarici TaxID=46677 RepID=A0A0X1T891_PSEAA|nr:2Fe-2S iron-sulfur cluster-binding protein [Pseudomonas agarici]AMB88133.1 flavin oxidoreductase [Pseudomonas agarici]NWB93029.1 2Fe-2S iron-sulfur cluster binding domain-containing protein [Pseudomonas agarici]NWC09296.1 2Fe-2S iron-sulfur cluster binding domain-containing protein [Pseudomonas agarici]SEK29128.1 CDP-4-dehydro-6-deoxyglucose reductase/3-phenylpropionate/trans-cinnamate dioxygenase ferredoxin reductase subunit [Pseudomonas agarici]